MADGATALAVLVGLQFLLTWLGVRVGAVRRLLKSEPVVLLRDGVVRHDARRAERVAESELRTAVRAQGIAALEDVAYAELETNGRISVIRDATHGGSALAGVKGADAPDAR